jgi:exodeoxyribonuclease VII small subunit
VAEPEQTLDFEATLTRLDEIVHQMESGQLTLQALLDLFEEGTQLGKRCQEQLDHAELRIQQVVASSGGGVSVTPLIPDAF